MARRILSCALALAGRGVVAYLFAVLSEPTRLALLQALHDGSSAGNAM